MTDINTIKPALNKNIDIGEFLIEDCQNYEALSEEKMLEKTQQSLCQFYKALFDLKKQQKLKDGGEDGEILEYTKSAFSVFLPKSKVILPREKPIPKQKKLTKWEKFRLEKGIQAKGKRSRLVFDPITNDWVPRHGMGSIKKIEDKYNWVMEEKQKHVEAGMDPFTFKKFEKKIEKEKQSLRELKNKIVNSGPAGSGNKIEGKDQILDQQGESDKGQQKINLKQKNDSQRDQIRKREQKAIMKSLTLAQISTASMGKFDKKAMKNEPAAPTSAQIAKKKSNSSLHKIESNKNLEKERNLKILAQWQKEKDYAIGGLDKSKAALNTSKMLKKNQVQTENFKKKVYSENKN